MNQHAQTPQSKDTLQVFPEAAPQSPLNAQPPAVPENWYMLATSAELGPGKLLARKVGETEIVVARLASGAPVAMAAHCAHMGCHLKHGAVVGEHLRCGLHYRKIQSDGAFLKPDGAPSRNLAQIVFPTIERYGAVFAFLGSGAPPALPAPDIIAEDKLLMRPIGEFPIATPWHALIANGFDMDHLLAVHARELKEAPDVARIDARTFRIGYRTRVTGRSLADRLIKWMSGDNIRASMTCIGGTIMIVQSHAGPRPSTMMLSLVPDGRGGTIVRTLAGTQGSPANLFDQLRVRFAGWLFKSFLRKDFAIFDGLDWRPPEHAYSAGDRYTHQMFDYFLDLPAAPAPRRRDLKSGDAA